MPSRTKDRPLRIAASPKVTFRDTSRKIQLLVTSLFFVGAFACDTGTSPFEASFLAFYRLEDPNIAASQIWDKPLADLSLAHEPFLTQREIRSYRWQTHEFEVAPVAESLLVSFKKRPGPVGGIPFAVTVGNDRIYLGAFWYPYSSLAPHVPFIDAHLDSHRICPSWDVQNGNDPRGDHRIYAALKAAGVLIE